MYDDCSLNPAYLRLRNLTLEVDAERLIDIRNLTLASRGVTVVMGPNGAGKSLLLRLLHGIEQPTTGEITSIDARREQSLVLQSPVLLRRSTEANLRFILKTRRLSTDAVPDLLRRVRLLEKAKTPARRLSGGERQRLAIALALATNPQLLLLDEPTASLDPSSTGMIEDILNETTARGIRVILVTHDAMQARRLAQDVVFLTRGRVVEHSSAATFFETPKTEMARNYLAGRLLP